MTKVRLLALIGLFIIFNALIFPVCFSNTSFTKKTTNIMELEDDFYSSSGFAYLSEKNVLFDALNSHSEKRIVRPPFSGFIQNLGQINDASIQSVSRGFRAYKLCS